MSDKPNFLADIPLDSMNRESLESILAILKKHLPEPRPAPPQSASVPLDSQAVREPTLDEGMYQIWMLDDHGNRQMKIEGHCCRTEQEFQDYMAMMGNSSGGKARAELVPSPGFEESHKRIPPFKPKR